MLGMPAPLYKRLGLDREAFRLRLLELAPLESQAAIAKRFGCDTTCIENWFRLLAVPSRSLVEAQAARCFRHVELDISQMDVLNGLLLSDLHLERQHVYSRASFGFKHRSFASAIIDVLHPLHWRGCKRNKLTGCWHAKTRTSDLLSQQRARWYPNGVKIVPQDLTLSPEVLYWWYLGDGMVTDYGLGLCTDGFSPSENFQLVEKLDRIGVASSYNGRRLRISSHSVCGFLKMIGPCRHQCYQYKWSPRLKRKDHVWASEQQ